MLSWNPFAKAPEAPPPAPGLLFTWTRDELQSSIVSGDCKPLIPRLTTLRETIVSVQSELRRDLRLCNADSVTIACSAMVPYVVTLLTLHPQSATAARFAAELITIIHDLLPRGALASALCPLLEGVAALRAAARAIDAENAKKWFYEKQLPRDRDALHFASLAIALAAADAVAAGVSLAGIGDAYAQLQAAKSLLMELPPDMHPASVVNAVMRSAATLLDDVETLLPSGEAAFVDLAFACAASAGRHLYATDVARVRQVAQGWLHSKRPKSGGPKAAAAACLAALWRSHTLSAESSDVQALVAAGAAALTAGTEGTGVCEAALLSLSDVFAATSFPKGADFDDAVREFTCVTLGQLVVKRTDVVAAATLVRKWYGLTLHRTLPLAVAKVLGECSVDCGAHQLLVVLREWPQGIGQERDEDLLTATEALCGVVGPATDRALTLAPGEAPTVTDHADVTAACIRAVTRSAFHPLPCLLRLLWSLLSAQAADALRTAEIVTHAGEHLARLVRTSNRDADAAVVSDALRALISVTERPWATPAVGAETVHAVFPVLDVAASRGGPWSGVTAECATALADLSARTTTSSAIKGLSIARLRLLARAYSRERGWLIDGPAVASIDRLLAPSAPLRPALAIRRDVRSAIAYSDPAVFSRAVCTVLCLQQRFRNRPRNNDPLTRSIRRRIIDFAGDGHMLHSALQSSKGGMLLLPLAT
uniref:Uncharacterized protein n=1 Tax=Neobodo designis TaxID=312471 RepID=A0A7S1L4F0_NEODS|mmetsp:Transcript_14683/g.45517  ORF Transcript_14683/g.45517 Transcript_14683/m.45517 type:complete len:710 (+) Transcript_14683:77-2206(+)